MFLEKPAGSQRDFHRLVVFEMRRMRRGRERFNALTDRRTGGADGADACVV